MDPEKLRASLEEWIAVSETFKEVAPGASLQDYIDYARSVVASPVAAQILAVAMSPAPTPAQPVAGKLAARR